MISLRVTPAEKDVIAQKAHQAGYQSASAFARDLLTGVAFDDRRLRMMSGALSRQGAALTRLGEGLAIAGHADLAATVRNTSVELALLQREIFQGNQDAGKSDR